MVPLFLVFLPAFSQDSGLYGVVIVSVVTAAHVVGCDHSSFHVTLLFSGSNWPHIFISFISKLEAQPGTMAQACNLNSRGAEAGAGAGGP